MAEIITVNEAEYTVVRLLGKGKGGYSYLVQRDGCEYVLKQIHHEPCDYYQFGDKLQSEIRDYERLRAVGIPMPRMLDVDTPRERILKEYIAGDTIFDLVKTDRMEETYLAQVKEMCAILYPAGINIDYFPTNFIPQEGKLYYIDFECNAYMDKWNFDNWGLKYWSKTPAFLEYRKSPG